MASVEEKVKHIIVEQLGVDEDEVKPEASFVDDLGADSLDVVELVMALEEEFGLEISDEDAEKLTTVKQADRVHPGPRQGVARAPACGQRTQGRGRSTRGIGAGMESFHERRVVITGMGLISPLGWTRVHLEGLLAGRSGVGPITRFDTALSAVASPARCAASTPRITSWTERSAARWTLFSHYAIAARRRGAGRLRLRDRRGQRRQGRCLHRLRDRRPAAAGATHRDLLERGPRRISPFFIPGMILNLAGGQRLDPDFGAKGPNLALATACATGTHAIGESYRTDRAKGYCRRDDRRRHRGGDHPAGGGRVLLHEGAIHTQRRAGAGQPALRCRARRVRHGGGRGHPDPRGARGARWRGAPGSTPRSPATA